VVLRDRGLRMPIKTSAHALEFASALEPTQVPGREVPFLKVAGPQNALTLGEAKNLLGLAEPAGGPRARARCCVGFRHSREKGAEKGCLESYNTMEKGIGFQTEMRGKPVLPNAPVNSLSLRGSCEARILFWGYQKGACQQAAPF